jgi:uncharacterized protein
MLIGTPGGVAQSVRAPACHAGGRGFESRRSRSLALSYAPPVRSRWRASPRRLASLLVGFSLFGAGEACLVASDLGNSPWSVFAQGLARQTALSVGTATIVISFGVLLLWIPLRQRPGLGTIGNAVGIGLAIDATLLLLPDHAPLAVRALEIPAGIALVAIGSAFYLGAALGPGPRDGLMTGLHRVTGRPIGLTRGTVEVAALAAGIVLGGTFGVGTVAFALGIGPAVARALRVARVDRPDTL